ncbi:MAG TPA: acyl-CoA dehydrogenase family protein [Nocardioides sp.]
MDFHLSEELTEVADLARTLFTDLSTIDRVREVEQGDSHHDDDLWAALSKAGLVGLAAPEEHGGADLGLAAACVVLEEQGRRVAPVGLWPHVVGTLAIADSDNADLRTDLLPALAEGRSRITLALEEPDTAEPATPGTTARVGEGGQWLLTGVKAAVPSPQGCEHVLVSATTDQGPGLFLVEVSAGDWQIVDTTSHDRAGHLTLQDTRAVVVGEPSDASLAAVLRRSTLALAAVQLGVAEGAMRLAASYLSERVQFGRPLGSFQAVQHQLADCWIDVAAMRVTLWEALSRDADSDSTAADRERTALVASWWRTQAGLDVVHRVQHVHGGMGVDVDYPVHRYFLWGKQLASTLGGAGSVLADLGVLVARERVVS